MCCDTLLVGHSLDNDLIALKLVHSKVGGRRAGEREPFCLLFSHAGCLRSSLHLPCTSCHLTISHPPPHPNPPRAPPKVLDTAVMFPHPRGPPYKSALRMLTQRHLKRSIQDGSHDSVADARAAMDLALLKIKHGGLVRFTLLWLAGGHWTLGSRLP